MADERDAPGPDIAPGAMTEYLTDDWAFFIRSARDLGFSIASIGELLKLWRDKRRPSTRVKALALEQIRLLEAKIREKLAFLRSRDGESGGGKS